ncbi:holo-ACP synthase [Acetonema longum]|uniref:Holo-[acyl-carrier-protein] synthase n=1 Tax=Acetonema longum DSM 6540 TaxID=1009370 RepID=F7NI63_9FIRM|nr:holo-ACP synthase [Acetonema longum]EGO64295.1 4'-phosphopantetheinyl transferase [Acetonema longum DSM 6540]
MILGIGIDIVEVDRMDSAIRRDAFVKRIFTEQEQRYCEGRGVQKAASYAARFAAKEAVLKALGTGMSGGGTWLEVEVVSDPHGRPVISLHGFFAALAAKQRVSKIHLSLTHAREYAAAQAVLWGGVADEGSNG